MATGTGNLPNPSMAFTPFDILLAAELNDLVENIEALATGTGIGDGAIATSDIANNAVTMAKIDNASYSIMRRKAGTNTSLSTSAATVNFSTTEYSRGTGLTTSGSTGILIGSGITLVRVSATIIAETMPDTYMFSRLRRTRGGVSVEFTSQLARAASGFVSNSHPSYDLEVQSGDVIDLRVDIGSGSASLQSSRPQWLQVEVVG